MSISATTLLQIYLAHDYAQDWCLASVVSKEGSSYRNPGAMMLIDPLGQVNGMVSGGCLEMDVVRRSRQVLSDNTARYIEYDMIDEESMAAELGIGCRGKLGVFIQPINRRCHQVLRLLYRELDKGRPCYLLQQYNVDSEKQRHQLVLLDKQQHLLAGAGGALNFPDLENGRAYQLIAEGSDRSSLTKIMPAINLMVFGGGADARPLVEIASTLGWRATVIDHRPAYAGNRYFPHAYEIIRQAPEQLSALPSRMDAAVVLTHNLKLDAAWLSWIFNNVDVPAYLGLLGPHERKLRVLEDITTVEHATVLEHVRGPVGVDLGGDLPESIALSILADIHAVLLDGSNTRLYHQTSGAYPQLKSV